MNPRSSLAISGGTQSVRGTAGAFSFTTGRIIAAIVLYVLVVILGIALYSPALKRQIAEAEADPNSTAYTEAAGRTNTYGIITTATVLVIVVLMVTKPF